MTFRTTVRQSAETNPSTIVAETALAEDPSHVYCAVAVTRPTDWFEHNAVRVAFSAGVGIEVTDEEGAAVLAMRDSEGRALAAALTAHYMTIDMPEKVEAAAPGAPVDVVGQTSLGDGLDHSDHTPHRA
jgi:hypothetical protein